jgi:tetratricopeptide (TPR) repeat protein
MLNKVIFSVLYILTASTVFAQSDSISVRQLNASGLHFDALVAAGTKTQLSLDDQLSAARSAWALGLADSARGYWDDALASDSLAGDEKIKELLARAILELQEGRLEDARSIAEKTAATLQSGDLRSQFWLLIAESLRIQGALDQSESYYQKAIAEGNLETKSEATYLLGEIQLKQGRMNDARYSFAGVESRGRFAVQAMKRLIEIDLSQKSYEGVLTWVDQGRENYPSEFEEPWIGYANITALLEAGRTEDAGVELSKLKRRHSEQEPWYQVASANYESKLLKSNMKVQADILTPKNSEIARGRLK